MNDFRDINQSPPLADYNAFDADPVLVEIIKRPESEWGVDTVRAFGQLVGSSEAQQHALQCELRDPVLVSHGRYGNRINEVRRDPSWHWIVDRSIEFDMHALPWRENAKPYSHTVRSVLVMLLSQLNLGAVCPTGGNCAMLPALMGQAGMEGVVEALRAPGKKDIKFAATAMTELYGGSDVRSNQTTAVHVGGGKYELSGFKWFVTCPWSEYALTLAQTSEGATCFLLDTDQPGYRIERLKDKVGWRSLGSGEVTLDLAEATLVGEEGRGISAIMAMVLQTRLDVIMESAAILRLGAVRAINHARYRSAFGSRLIDKPAMRNVLADLAIESEAATVSAMRIARSYDEPNKPFRRLATSLVKYWISKRGAAHAAEALECFGGNGYVEDFGMGRLYRDAPLASIWEGSGNVTALDILRAMKTSPESVDAVIDECNQSKGGNAALDNHLNLMADRLAALKKSEEPEWHIRRIAEDMALALQGALLVRYSPHAVSDAYCASRLGERSLVYGGLPAGVDVNAILSRALPV
ncbi:MAG: acyl-CoA dehydrogenase family protein [Parvibaculaceae bacterium]